MLKLLVYIIVDMDLSIIFFFSSRRRHTRLQGDWSSDVCSSDLDQHAVGAALEAGVDARDVAAVEPHGAGLAPPDRGELGDLEEIGRASCREREKIQRISEIEKI